MTDLTRRSFLKSASLASASAVALPHILGAQEALGVPEAVPAARQTPNTQKLRVAIIGVGGQGDAAVAGMRDENIVALCDVDEARMGETFKKMVEKYPETLKDIAKIPVYKDYRQMLDKIGNQIDAVTVSTPDHMHYPIALAALQMGKHLFVEKPLTHTIWEARQLAKLAREKKVATQMGQPGHAGEGCRLLKEWVQAGVLGQIREIHSWSDRPMWPQGQKLPDHSKAIPVPPPTLDWNLWLGVAPERPYDPAYVPFNWRGWWDFGCGAMGDMGCHLMDGTYYALELGAPTAVEAIAAPVTDQSPPTSSVVTMYFPARTVGGRGGRKMPPVKYTWSDGGIMPRLPDGWEKGRKFPKDGTLIYGSKATVLADTTYKSIRIVPEAKMKEIAPHLPPKTIPRVEGGLFAEWIRACKGGPPAGANFDYSGPFTETVLLGNVALRTQRRIEWDSAAMRVTNIPEANDFITKKYRGGFGV